MVWNQINDANPSQILGNLNANGYVVLQNANPAFTSAVQAVINTHGLLMTTAPTPNLNLSDGTWLFDAPPPTANIINYGQINIAGADQLFSSPMTSRTTARSPLPAAKSDFMRANRF